MPATTSDSDPITNAISDFMCFLFFGVTKPEFHRRADSSFISFRRFL